MTHTTQYADTRELATWTMQLFAPPPRVPPSQFVHMRRRLTKASGAAEPGIYNMDRTPYLREPLDRLWQPGVRKGVWMKNAQSGVTTGIIENSIYYSMHINPRNYMLVKENLEQARKYSKGTLDSMIDENPTLKAVMMPPRWRGKSNTILEKKHISGAGVTLFGANSPTSFSAFTFEAFVGDDIDRWKVALKDSGDPVSLGEGRVSRIHNAKIILVSTPTLRGASRIEQEFAKGTQSHYHMQCPHCRHWQIFLFSPNSIFAKPTSDITTPPVIGGLAKGYLKFDKENCTWAAYICEKCQKEIDEKHRERLIEGGRWVDMNPTPAHGVISYHISEMITTINASWVKLAQEFLAKKSYPEQLRVYINEKLGETSTQVDTYEVTESMLRDRRTAYFTAPQYTVPQDVLVLVASCDLQIDRIELLLAGHGLNQQAWHLEHKVFQGSPEYAEVWQTLDEYLHKMFTHELGFEMEIATCVIDMGDWQDIVIEFTKSRLGRRIIASKGFSGNRPLVAPSQTKEGIPFLRLGHDRAKQLVFERINASEGNPGRMYFNHNMDESYFTQLTNARYVTDWSSGMPRSKWVMKNKTDRDEILDLWCMNYAGLSNLRVDWRTLSANIAELSARAKQPNEQQQNRDDDDDEPPTNPFQYIL